MANADGNCRALDSMMNTLYERGSSSPQEGQNESIDDGSINQINSVLSESESIKSPDKKVGGATPNNGGPHGSQQGSDMAQLKMQMESLAKIINDNVMPFVSTVKQMMTEGDSNERELDEDDEMEPPAKKQKTKEAVGSPSTSTITVPSKLEILSKEVVKTEECSPPVEEKWAEIIQRIASEGLNEEIKKERIEIYNRPENTTYLQTTRVYSSIWKSANSETTTRDTALKKCLETLIAGVIPMIQVSDVLRKAIDKNDTPPTLEEMWESTSNAAILSVSAIHELNVIRRQCFKPNMGNYKSLCSTKTQPITEHLFGDKVEEKVKELDEVVKTSNKLTKKEPGKYYNNGNFNEKFRKNFLGGKKPAWKQNRDRFNNYQQNKGPRRNQGAAWYKGKNNQPEQK